MLHIVNGNADDVLDIQRKYGLVLVPSTRTGQELDIWIDGGDNNNNNKILCHTPLLMIRAFCPDTFGGFIAEVVRTCSLCSM
jgi:hypothetical protein